MAARTTVPAHVIACRGINLDPLEEVVVGRVGALSTHTATITVDGSSDQRTVRVINGLFLIPPTLTRTPARR